MGVSTAGSVSGPKQSLRGWIGGYVVGLASGMLLCGVVWVFTHVSASEARKSVRRGAEATQAVAAGAARVRDEMRSQEPGHSELAATEHEKKPAESLISRDSSLPKRTDLVRGKREEKAIDHSPPPARLASATNPIVSRNSNPFDLAPPTAAIPVSFVLPNKPWFALDKLTAEEPSSSGESQEVCAVNRSLNTALVWAKSPAEAAVQARREGKLVFLIHVSGNFEDPGFT